VLFPSSVTLRMAVIEVGDPAFIVGITWNN